MSDLIDRQAAIDALEKSGYCYDQFLGVESVLNALPSARSCETCRYSHLMWSEEPCDSCTCGGESNHWKPKEPERKKGEWIKMPYHVTECSECGFSLEDWIQGAFYNFCPNCGCPMKGETDERN